MSTDQRRTDAIFLAIQELTADKASFRPGDLASFLRDRGQPVAVWELRGDLSKLESAGHLTNDPVTGAWSLKAASRKAG